MEKRVLMEKKIIKDGQEYFLIPEVAEKLDINPMTLRLWVKTGRIKPYKPDGKRVFVSLKEVQDDIELQKKVVANIDNEYMTKEQLLESLKTSLSSFDRLFSKKFKPFIIVQGKYYFTRTEVLHTIKELQEKGKLDEQGQYQPSKNSRTNRSQNNIYPKGHHWKSSDCTKCNATPSIEHQ